MNPPSEKKLCELLNLSPEQAKLVRDLAKNVDNRDNLEALIELYCPETWRYAHSCHSWPFQGHMWRCVMVLHAVDCILGTCGVESMRTEDEDVCDTPTLQYCNTGDLYAPTLFYSSENELLFISCYETEAQNLER